MQHVSWQGLPKQAFPTKPHNDSHCICGFNMHKAGFEGEERGETSLQSCGTCSMMRALVQHVTWQGPPKQAFPSKTLITTANASAASTCTRQDLNVKSVQKPSPRLRDLLDNASTCAARVMARPAKASFSHENFDTTANASAASTCTRQDLRAKSVEKPLSKAAGLAR